MKRLLGLLLILLFIFSPSYLKPSRKVYAFLTPPPSDLMGLSHYSDPVTQENYRRYPISTKEKLRLFYHKDELTVFRERDAININPGQRSLFPDPFTYENNRIDYFIRHFQGQGRGNFEVWLARSNKYITLVKKIFDEYGLPEDLSYLALIESGFNPKAYSKARAVGIWQFIKGTAKSYGLRLDWWVDERRDPEKSTHAAARHLRSLYETFGSWPLAIAAYNSGEGRIRRAIKRYKTDDIWEIIKTGALPKETRDYFPKFLASLRIVKRPDLYRFGDIKPLEPVKFDKVTVPHATDLRVIAEASNTSLKKIKELNPELRRWFTPPDYPNYRLKIPSGKREIYLKNIATIPFDKRIVFHKHKVKKGETLSHISRQYHTSTKAIMYLNNIKNPRYLRAGAKIVVPVRGEKQRLRKAVLRKPQGSSLRKVTYTVRKGDSIWNIANSFGIRPNSIYRWNEIDPTGYIFPGDEIVIYLRE